MWRVSTANGTLSDMPKLAEGKRRRLFGGRCASELILQLGDVIGHTITLGNRPVNGAAEQIWLGGARRRGIDYGM
jgi:hypothetical protein